MKKGAATVRTALMNRVKRFSGARVLVAGDIMVDRYYWGKVQRISPEAPVPVVEVTDETRRLGGAANVAHNIRALGGLPLLVGVAGQDREGEWLLGELERVGVDSRGVVTDPEIPTTVKSRVVAHNQQVVRFDREKKAPPPAAVRKKLEGCLISNWKDINGAVVSDYAKGVVHEKLMDRIRSLNRTVKSVPVAVDPKSSLMKLYRHMSVITPNYQEAMAVASVPGEGGNTIEKVGARLLRATRATAILITRGEDGMSLFERGRDHCYIPTDAREVYDVTGAGDTVIGTISLALASGSSMREAACLANIAAGVVVGEFGTVPVMKKQLVDNLPRVLPW